jgi:predicted metal-dependent peptidase
VLAGAIKRSIAHKAGQVDYSYRRPGRRRIPNVVTPSMRRPVPTLAVVVDTSGSMSNDDIRAALSEVQGISRQVGVRGPQLRLLMVDADVHTVAPVFDVRAVEVRGGGGTDMRVGITGAETLSPKPDAIVVLTDGFTPWPDSPTSSRLVIGLIGNEANVAQAAEHVPEWATTVIIDTADI